MLDPGARPATHIAVCDGVENWVFCEPEKGFVAHKAASGMLRDEAWARDMLGWMFDECWQSMARVGFCVLLERREVKLMGIDC